jgi:hypothetical protein
MGTESPLRRHVDELLLQAGPTGTARLRWAEPYPSGDIVAEAVPYGGEDPPSGTTPTLRLVLKPSYYEGYPEQPPEVFGSIIATAIEEYLDTRLWGPEDEGREIVLTELE